MNILGLIEIRPFDGTDPFVCLRIEGPRGAFDLPLDREQLSIILENYPNNQKDIPEEDLYEESVEEGQTEAYTPSPVVNPNPEAYVVNSNAEFSMGASSMWEDDDL